MRDSARHGCSGAEVAIKIIPNFYTLDIPGFIGSARSRSNSRKTCVEQANRPDWCLLHAPISPFYGDHRVGLVCGRLAIRFHR
jgi:hypothetical protein